jgi:hypothetical protein
MQSELKAVLTALEQFSISHHHSGGTPDLVQNLPEKAETSANASPSSSNDQAEQKEASKPALVELRRASG